MEDSRVAFVNYHSLSATEPLGLIYHRGSIYLVAASRGHGELRHFKVDQISDVVVGKFTFDRPADFDLASHLAGSFGVFQGNEDVRVRVRFRPPVVRYVKEKKWHASEQREPQPDGALIAQYRLSGVEEIKRWLLRFGRHAEVLEPVNLRTEIQEEAQALSAIYGHSKADKVEPNGRQAQRGTPIKRGKKAKWRMSDASTSPRGP